MRDNDRVCSKRGYPDFTVYNSDGTIYGFVEVKPNDDKELKPEQKVFAEFCHKHKIPFTKWCPEYGEKPLKDFLSSGLA